jgi:hypothetical protein
MKTCNLIRINSSIHDDDNLIYREIGINRFFEVFSAVLFFLGLSNPPGTILFIAAGVLVFSALYDRCPIYKALAPRVAQIFKRHAP